MQLAQRLLGDGLPLSWAMISLQGIPGSILGEKGGIDWMEKINVRERSRAISDSASFIEHNLY
jgi:hypothetical protein